MTDKVEKWDHVGKQPILVRGQFYEKGAVIDATEAEMAFFVTIGAVKKKGDPELGSLAPAPEAVADTGKKGKA